MSLVVLARNAAMGCRWTCRPETENGMNAADTIQLLILIVMAIQLGLEIARRK